MRAEIEKELAKKFKMYTNMSTGESEDIARSIGKMVDAAISEKVAAPVDMVVPVSEPQEFTWIPVSERLPDDDRLVMISIRWLDTSMKEEEVKNDVYVGAYSHEHKQWWCYEDYYVFYDECEVVAWAPLPKHYCAD